MKRAFDLIVSFLALVILSPAFIIISLIILIDNFGSVFYLQKRVGINNNEFNLYKLRTMYSGSDKKGLLTVGVSDKRITRVGMVLRRYKLDELPQLINVFLGSMSIVGPRPEVRKYVELYNEEQKKVLTIKPGITDYASILYKNENEILAKSTQAETTYVEEIMPHKLSLNLEYIENRSFKTDLKIILKTIREIFS